MTKSIQSIGDFLEYALYEFALYLLTLLTYPSQSYGASPAMWDHTVLAAIRHR